MRLRKPCEHDRYDEHDLFTKHGTVLPRPCPGGEFLPEDALVIEKDADGDWPRWAQGTIVDHVGEGDDEPYLAGMLAVGILDALADQVGEPG